MSEKQKYYITTAIAYTSGKPHIGNTYEIVLADAIARYKRSQGYDVFFQTGTDEHGQKIELKAEEAGVTPKEFVDGVSAEIKKIWDLMDTSYDKFIRTTDEDHEKQVQKIFKKLYDQGDIYKGHYEGMYCTPCESFFTESQLVDGKCPDCGREVQPAKEEAYFFKMSKYADRLIEHINTHPEFIQPVSRKNEMMNNFLLPGLQDLCVSDSEWGVSILRYFNPIGAHKSGRIGEDPNGIPGNLMPYITQVAIGKLECLNVCGNDYPTPDGTGVRDYIHVVDLAKGHVAAIQYLMSHTGEGVFNLGTGHGYSVLDMVHAFEEANGVKVPYEITARRLGDLATCYADPAKSLEVLGWKAEKNLVDMCRDTWNWQKQNPNGYEQ